MKIYDTTSLPGEEWRDIPGYEGLYQASSYGMIRNKNGYMLKGSTSKGYRGVHFSSLGKSIRYPVSRVIAGTFLGLDFLDKTPMNKNKILVCHKDDNPLNNRLDNLFLGTPKQNSIDMVNKNRTPKMYGKKNPMYGKTGSKHHLSKKVFQYSLDGEFIKEYGSISDAEKAVGGSHVWDCCVGRYKTSKGYKFSFVKL